MLTIAIFTFQRTKQLIQCILSIDCLYCNEILVFNDDENNRLDTNDLLVSNDIKKIISIYNPSDFNYKNRTFRKPQYINKALKIAKNENILLSDDDGVFGPNSIKIHLQALKTNQFCAGSIMRNILFKNYISKSILQGTNISINKKLFFEIGGYDEKYSETGGGGDVDFWYRIYNYSKHNAINVAYLPKAYQRVTQSSKRKKDSKIATDYTKNKHNIDSNKKMYRWFMDIRDKSKWMKIID
tara:strand:- start:2170 stop:2892 length:723 start_codon:yes stop_codon:yes gene_type:complete